MDYNEILKNARECSGPYCKACPVCNGMACRTQVPGPGGKGTAATMLRNYQKWQEVCINMDTICENAPIDTTFTLFGRKFAAPIFAAPVGAMKLHYGDKYDDLTYNDILVSSCAQAGIAAFTGDGTNPAVMEGALHAITAANNLLCAILDNHMQQGNVLGIDQRRVLIKRCVDMNDRQLRHIVCGLGGKASGVPREDGFDIVVASEVMAVLCLSADLADMKARLAKMVVAYNRAGQPITAHDLKAEGAMAAVLKDAIKPNLVQTLEHTPAFIHGGPFANIAHGCNSIQATETAMKLADYTVTEAGFAADLGAEKFLDIKCRLAGLKPNAVVIVATIRALKMHGGGPKVTPGAPLPKEYTEENLELLEKGTCNLFHHVNTIKKSGINPVVCINRFYTDTDAEIALLKKLCKEKGVRCAESNHWRFGGEGAIELAKTVVEACEEPVEVKFLYDLEMPLRQRVELIAKEVYGADGVDWAPLAVEKAKRFETDPKYKDYCTMMVKTHLSLSDDPSKKGVPTGWRLAIRDILEYGGAKFLCPMAGTISMMPGTAANPAYRRIDVDTETGKVSGLF